MTPIFTARRSAAEFASVIDGTAADDVNARYAELVSTVGVLQSQEAPVARPDFVTNLRAGLMLAADAVLVAADPSVNERLELPHLRSTKAAGKQPVRVGHHRERRIGAVAAALIVVGASAGMAAAAQGSLPGDPLYPIKRGIESAEVSLHTNDSSKGGDMLSQADTRLGEVKQLLAARSAKADEVTKTLSDFTTSADNGSDLLFKSYQRDGDSKDIAAVRSFAASQMTALQKLQAISPASSSAAFASAANVLADIDQQARVLCGACSSASPLSAPDALLQLTSSKSLNTLLGSPVKQAQIDAAQQAIKRIQQAQKNSGPNAPAADGQGAGGTDQQPTTPPPSTSSPGGGPVTGLVKGPLGQVVTPPVTDLAKPVQTLVTQLTSTTGGLGKGLGDTLGQTLNGVGGLLK